LGASRKKRESERDSSGEEGKGETIREGTDVVLTVLLKSTNPRAGYTRRGSLKILVR